MISIAVDSQFEHLSRYNIIIMCGGFDSSEQQLYVVSAQDCEEKATLDAPDAKRIELIIYLVPKEIPQAKHIPITALPPFEITVSINHDATTIYNKEHTINAWSGAALNIKIEL